MKAGNNNPIKNVRVIVQPGDCEFETILTIISKAPRVVGLEAVDSGCERIHDLTRFLDALDLAKIFYPICKNPVYKAAEKAGLHPSCAIPAALLKGMEIALDLAVAKKTSAIYEVL
jgi:hypothetical protein